MPTVQYIGLDTLFSDWINRLNQGSELVDAKAAKLNNLSDLPNPASARVNLGGINTTADMINKFVPSDVGSIDWLNITKSLTCRKSGNSVFDVDVAANTINMGTFQISDYVNILAGDFIIHSDTTSNDVFKVDQLFDTINIQNVVIDNDLFVDGNVVFRGTTNINSGRFDTGSPYLKLNSDYVGSAPSENAGIEGKRGSSASGSSIPNIHIRWNESADNWELSADSTNFYPIIHEGNVGDYFVANNSPGTSQYLGGAIYIPDLTKGSLTQHVQFDTAAVGSASIRPPVSNGEFVRANIMFSDAYNVTTAIYPEFFRFRNEFQGWSRDGSDIFEYFHDGITDDTSLDLISNETLATQGNDGYGFGNDIALSANGLVMVVGCPYYDQGASVVTGSVETYDYIGSTWVLRTILQGPNPANGDLFGYGVSLSDDGGTLYVGAPGREEAYKYFKNNLTNEWVLDVTITPDTPETGEKFGWAVECSDSGDRVFVGAPLHSYTGTQTRVNRGRVLAFSVPKGGNPYTQKMQITPNELLANLRFGSAIVSMDDGGKLAISTPGDGAGRGSIRTYNEKSANVWSQVDYAPVDICIPDGDTGNVTNFGKKMALSPDGKKIAVVYTSNDTNGTSYTSERVAIADTRRQYNEYEKSTAPFPFYFHIADYKNNLISNSGTGIAMSNDRFFIASETEREATSVGKITAHIDGDRYCIHHHNGQNVYKTDTQDVIRVAPQSTTGYNFTGPWTGAQAIDVSNDGKTMVVAYPYVQAQGVSAGLVIIFRKMGDDWVQMQILSNPKGNVYNGFADDVAISGNGNYIAVSSSNYSHQFFNRCGGINVYKLVGSGEYYKYLGILLNTSSERRARSKLGVSVAMNYLGDHIYAGRKDSKVYMFHTNNNYSPINLRDYGPWVGGAGGEELVVNANSSWGSTTDNGFTSMYVACHKNENLNKYTNRRSSGLDIISVKWIDVNKIDKINIIAQQGDDRNSWASHKVLDTLKNPSGGIINPLGGTSITRGKWGNAMGFSPDGDALIVGSFMHNTENGYPGPGIGIVNMFYKHYNANGNVEFTPKWGNDGFYTVHNYDATTAYGFGAGVALDVNNTMYVTNALSYPSSYVHIIPEQT